MTIIFVSQLMLIAAMLVTLCYDLLHFKERPETQLVWCLWFVGSAIICVIQLSPLTFWYLFLTAMMLLSRWSMNKLNKQNGGK